MDQPKSDKPQLVRVAERPADESYSHPLNPKSEVRGISLSRLAGLERVGLNLIRVPPGKEANIYHAHGVEEEFFYILSGRGVATIDGKEHEIGPGDFMGFPAPSVGHGLANPSDEDLVYLVGGECSKVEFARYPTLHKSVIRYGGEAHIVDDDALSIMWKAD
jgi:uncharacterized cupin superfamily protein